MFKKRGHSIEALLFLGYGTHLNLNHWFNGVLIFIIVFLFSFLMGIFTIVLIWQNIGYLVTYINKNKKKKIKIFFCAFTLHPFYLSFYASSLPNQPQEKNICLVYSIKNLWLLGLFERYLLYLVYLKLYGLNCIVITPAYVGRFGQILCMFCEKGKKKVITLVLAREHHSFNF